MPFEFENTNVLLQLQMFLENKCNRTQTCERCGRWDKQACCTWNPGYHCTDAGTSRLPCIVPRLSHPWVPLPARLPYLLKLNFRVWLQNVLIYFWKYIFWNTYYWSYTLCKFYFWAAFHENILNFQWFVYNKTCKINGLFLTLRASWKKSLI